MYHVADFVVVLMYVRFAVLKFNGKIEPTMLLIRGWWILCVQNSRKKGVAIKYVSRSNNVCIQILYWHNWGQVIKNIFSKKTMNIRQAERTVDTLMCWLFSRLSGQNIEMTSQRKKKEFKQPEW